MINGFRKEMMFFTRGGRLALVVIVTLALAVMSPLMFGMMKYMIDMISEAAPDDSYTEMLELFSGFTAAEITMYTAEYVAGIGAIVVLFAFKGAAGGEQQKRSVIIPQCSGLSAVSYALPKFLIYPVFIFVTGLLSVYAGAGASLIFFEGPLDWGMITVSAVCAAGFLAFSTAVQFCIGLCTGRSGLAVAACVIMQTFLPSLLSFFRVDRFNPFALYPISLSAALAAGDKSGSLFSALEENSVSSDVTTLNVAVSLGTAL